MATTDCDRMATVASERWIGFQEALTNKRTYPVQEFQSFADAIRNYMGAIGHAPVIHRSVAEAVNGLRDFLEQERKTPPADVIWEAERLETLVFSGYDPHFEWSGAARVVASQHRLGAPSR